MDPLQWLTLSTGWATAVFVVEFVVKVVALGVVPENRHPGSAHAWLFLILLVPVVGLPLFLLLGSSYLRGRRNRIQLQAALRLETVTAEMETVPDDVEVDDVLRPVLEMNRRLTSVPCARGRFTGVWSDSAGSITAMTEAVESARTFCHVEFYAQSWDDETDAFYRALIAAADRGVDVRLLVDHLGTVRYRGFATLRRRLDASAVHWRFMLPLNPFRGRFRRPDLRNHRKLLVVDGRVGFVGSQNMIGRHYGSRRNSRCGREWVDVMVRVEGDVVRSVDAIFAVDWRTEAGEVLSTVREEPQAVGPPARDTDGPEPADDDLFQIVPSGPGYPTEPNMRLFTQLAGLATRSLRIVSPYFVPNEALQEAVTSAAYRGVVVEVYVPEQADQFLVHHAQRSYYRALLEAGVRVYLYPAPKVLHSKLVLVDDGVAVVGSSNLDMRSFLLNFEVSMLMAGGSGPAALAGVVDGYRAESTLLDMRTWEARPWLARYVDNVARLTSALQ